MIPIQLTYTEYQRAEQPIADFITHLLWMIKKIASPFVLEYRQWVSTSTPGGNASDVALPIAYTQWYKIVATGVVDSSDADFKQTVSILKDYKMSLQSFALRTSGQDKPAAFCITVGV